MQRYSRQIHEELLSEDQQRILEKSTVSICGCGGLGIPAATYLAAAGIGTLHLFDKDVVELTNLNRQILYNEEDIGKPKATLLATRLQQINHSIAVIPHVSDILETHEFAEIVCSSDIIIDCLDTVQVRIYVGTVAELCKKPIIHGGIRGWFGQLAIFMPNNTPSLMTMLEELSEKPSGPVIGVIPGIIGTSQALECIKMLIGSHCLDDSMMYVFDGLEMKWMHYPKKT